MKQRIWAVWASIFLASAHAAAFDCKSARLSGVEQQICGDAELTAQDQALAALYGKLQSVSSAPQRDELKRAQQKWLAQVRDACADRECLATAYEARLGELSDLYEERWGPRVPADVLKELSRRSNLSEKELREILRDCTGTQFAMNICSFGVFVQADLEMTRVLSQKMSALPARCRPVLQTGQSEWAIARDDKCNKEADDEAGGGSMRPMVFTGCQAAATEERIARVKALKSCEGGR